MLFNALFFDIKQNPSSVPPQKQINIISTTNMIIENDYIKKNIVGCDERYDNDSNSEQIYNISLWLFYLDKIIRLQNIPLTDELKNDLFIRELNDISTISITAGGLMDDWNRDI
jgi:hypothetical protein